MLSFFRRLVLLGGFCFASISVSAQTNSVFRGDLRHTGFYQTDALHHYRHLAWRFKADGPIRGAVALAGGRVYFGSGDGGVYALEQASGAVVWHVQTGGAVASAPAVVGGTVYVASRDRYVYALDAGTGQEQWRFLMGKPLPYAWGFDEYMSSPAVVDGVVFIGSGDGHVYALDAATGQEQWRFLTEGLVRASPAVDGGTLYAGDTEGWLYALDQQTGAQRWRFGSEGARLDAADFGYDREALVSSPALTDDLVVVGGRDGFLYGVERATGVERWRVNHEISWVVSSPALDDEAAYVGSSDGRFIQAVDLKTGAERWRTPTPGNIWSSVALAEGIAYVGGMEGRLYALDAKTGEVLWRMRTNAGIKATPVIADGVVYVGDDNGDLYAVTGTRDPDPDYRAPRKAVYWEDTPGYTWFHYDTDQRWRDLLVDEGFTLVAAADLATFMRDRITDGEPSVVVFAANRVPPPVVADTSETALIRQYLDAGGKVVWLGPPPVIYLRDWKTEQVTGLDFDVMDRLFGIRYPAPRARAYGTFAHVAPTAEGRQWGLSGWGVACCSVPSDQVTTVLTRDEFGDANAWLKNFGGSPGTGLLSLRLQPDRIGDVAGVMTAILFGL